MSDPTSFTPAGWYPDPAGGPGQKYWDGAQWVLEVAAPPPVANPDGITKTDIKNWATHGLAGYSALVGVVSLPLALLCGVGIVLGVPAIGMGYFANRSSQQSPTGRKLAMTGIICGGISTAISVLIWLILF